MRHEPDAIARRQLKHFAAFWLITIACAGCDLQTKAWAKDAVTATPSGVISLIEPHVDIVLTYNRGTAFSIVRDLGSARVVFGVFALLVVILLAWMQYRSEPQGWQTLALGTLAGGAIGNGYDRVFRVMPDGGTGVVDFVRINYPWGGSWPAFNVADALLVVGVAAILLAWRSGDPQAADLNQPTK